VVLGAESLGAGACITIKSAPWLQSTTQNIYTFAAGALAAGFGALALGVLLAGRGVDFPLLDGRGRPDFPDFNCAMSLALAAFLSAMA
jgi:hypothetical protein